MRALVLTKYRELEFTEADRPAAGATDVLVRVGACGICGSDVHGYDGSSGRRIPPLIMGHEAAGVVEEIGSAVDRVRVGDRVTFDSTISCGRCDACRRGNVNLCENRRVLGVSCGDYRQHGAFAEFVVVPQHIIYTLPAGMPLEHAAMIEPVSVAVHAVKRLAIQPGERAAVVGSGMIGLLVIQALREAGCEEVVAIDVDDRRLALAKELGASATVNSRSVNAVSHILELTGGEGVDLAVEVVGNAAAFETAIGCVRRGGRVGLVGNLSPEVPFPLQAVVTREITLVGSCASAGEYGRAIELVASGAIRVDPLISAVAPLAEGPQWFERLYAHEPGLMKVILQP
ncbi:MAG TPA: galactitol-1-phosphate 5-dehydrogenase [Lacipirellulaceae bacterium]|nr:galactitol-1-phosphate 5-dehydrogenase [Lacipirellulaceae bacterium]